MELKENGPSEWDRLLVKYVYVWLWSILLATATGIAFSFISYRFERWGLLGSVLVMFELLGAFCVGVSLLALGRFLRGFLLPVFFGGIEGDRDQHLGASRLLARSFTFLILAVIFRFLMSATELMLNLGGFEGSYFK